MESEKRTLAPQGIDESDVLLDEPEILDEIAIEELSIDGICGVY